MNHKTRSRLFLSASLSVSLALASPWAWAFPWGLGASQAHAAPRTLTDPLFVSPTDADTLAPESTLFFGVGGFRSTSEGSQGTVGFEALRQEMNVSSGVVLHPEKAPIEFRFGLGVTASFGTSRLDVDGLVSNAQAKTMELRTLGFGSLVAHQTVHLGAGFEVVRSSVTEEGTKGTSVSAARPIFGIGLRLNILSLDFSARFPLEKTKQGTVTDKGKASTATLDEPMHLTAKGTWRSTERLSPGISLAHTGLERKPGQRVPTEGEKWSYGAFAHYRVDDAITVRPLITSRRIAPAGHPLALWGASLQVDAHTFLGIFTPEMAFSFGKNRSKSHTSEVAELHMQVAWRSPL